MAEATVRPAQPADAPTLARLQIAVWQQAYAELLPAAVLLGDPERHAQTWADRVTAGGPVLLALEGREPVGLAAVAEHRAEDGSGEIELLHVLPRWGRRGHGGRLLAAAADRLRGSGATRGQWWAPEDDRSVRMFLAGVSWGPDGGRRVLDTGEGTFTEVRYAGDLGLIAL